MIFEACNRDEIGVYMHFKIVLEECEEGGYTVYVPALSGCISEGETKEEAISNIKEAIELYIDTVDDDILIYNNQILEEIVI